MTACSNWRRTRMPRPCSKDLSANLQALGLFGIDDVFACRHSLAERGLAPPASAQPLDSEAISQLIDRYDQVMTL